MKKMKSQKLAKIWLISNMLYALCIINIFLFCALYKLFSFLKDAKDLLYICLDDQEISKKVKEILNLQKNKK